MKKLNIETRLALTAIIMACIFGILSFAFFSSLVEKDLLALHLQTLAVPPVPSTLTQAQVLDLGIDQTGFEKFVTSAFNERGFVLSNGSNYQLVRVIKNGIGNFTVTTQQVGLIEWWRVVAKDFVIGLVVLCLFSFLVVYTFSKISIQPLSVLRKTTEDILAGQFEVNLKYQGSDEIGTTFMALKKLCVEIEKKDKALETVSELATTDGLTGLKNHRTFKEEFSKQLSLSQRHGDSLGLMILDVDHFKKFNDTYGHQQGDEVLKCVGATLKHHIRGTDFVARYGGEEFVVVFIKPNLNGFKERAQKLREAIETTKVSHLAKPSDTLTVTASFGCIFIGEKSLPPRGNVDLATFVEYADKNLYTAKKQGRNCCVVSQWAKPII